VLEDLEEIVVEGILRLRRRPVDLAVEVLDAPCGFRVCREPLVRLGISPVPTRTVPP
jgi:hypothetical protein